MIGRLQGKLVYKRPPELLLDVNGVGYEIEAPLSTFGQLPEAGHQTVLYTHLIIREDCQLLFGFSDEEQRSLFRTLIKVSGVGAKMAIALLSSIEPQEFVRCVMDNDSQTLTRLPGIGRKIAERLVIEMRDKLKDWSYSEAGVTGGDGAMEIDSNDQTNEAVNALVALGYKPQEAKRAVNKACQKVDGGDSEQLIRAALKTSG